MLPDVKSQLIGKDSDAGKNEGKRRRGLAEDEMVREYYDSIDMNLSRLWEILDGRGAWHPRVHEVTKGQTQLSDWTRGPTNQPGPALRI